MFGWGISEQYKRDYRPPFSTPCPSSECSDVAVSHRNTLIITAFFNQEGDASTQTHPEPTIWRRGIQRRQSTWTRFKKFATNTKGASVHSKADAECVESTAERAGTQ